MMSGDARREESADGVLIMRSNQHAATHDGVIVNTYKTSAYLPKVPVAGITGDNCSLKTEEKMMSTAEVAEFLGVPIGTIRNMTSAGRIPYYKLGSLNRYSRNELSLLLKSKRKGGFSYGN